MLTSKTINFGRADKYEDVWEGKLSKLNWNYEKNVEMYGDDAGVMLEVKRQVFSKAPAKHHMSCWSISDYESTAMWKEYGSDSHGVAIKTTWGAVGESIHFEEPAYGLRVHYGDPATELAGERLEFHPLLFKRHYFEHEKEARVLFKSAKEVKLPDDSDGNKYHDFLPVEENIQLPVNLDLLIGELVFGARLLPWEREMILNVAKQNGISFNNSMSLLSELPYI